MEMPAVQDTSHSNERVTTTTTTTTTSPEAMAPSTVRRNGWNERQRRKNGYQASDSGVSDDEKSQEKPYATGIKQVPVTMDRIPYSPSVHDKLVDPGTARATIAASRQAPNGTTELNYARRHQDQTVLQQHVQYFDPDNDKIIWPLDTYRGFRSFGWNSILSFLAMILIHGGLSYPTVPGWLPDPFFRIYIANVHKAKHGSDSMTYDNEGRFRPQQFEDFFSKFDKDNKGGVTWKEITHALHAQALVFDFFGVCAAFLEWTATYVLLWPSDGILKKDDVRTVYDGSIFYKKAQEYRATSGGKEMNGKGY